MYTTSVIYAVFTMIRSRPVSCTYCHIINVSITTITLCIDRKCKKQKESSIIMYTTSVIYAVFTMIRSRPVSCTYCHIINVSITTITLCIAQKMQEAERIFNHHVYNVGDIRCIHDDSKSSCFLYLLSHNQREYYHNHIRYCTENARSRKNLQSSCIQRR